MLIRYCRQFFQRFKQVISPTVDKAEQLQRAWDFRLKGDMHAAVVAFRAYLKLDPQNVQALNDLGTCLADIGNNAEATEAFELAYALDDTYIPVVVNHAKILLDRRLSQEALPFLRQAKIYEPDFPYVDSVYASLAFSMGDVAQACRFQQRAWLSSFDSLRFANSHLFYHSYADVDEKIPVAEHSFWAETLRPVTLIESAVPSEAASALPALPEKNGRTRIGYWSPDFRSHSVSFFFRPLLQNHDPERVDVVLYHDFPGEDAQTALIYMDAPHFYRVSDLSDVDLCALLRSHELDVFVELAGHSSHNRLSLLQQRFAPVQMSALGYPPTTGLRSIDAKLVDRHILTPGGESYYSETPLALPSSFWCFDLLQDAPVADEPPLVTKGYVTFACVGNIAKINTRMLRCWQQILQAVPHSRLLLRSINFEDDAAMVAMRVRLQDAGIDTDRVDCYKPVAGAAYALSYNEIDIVLDTFPFNGGTTSCFAAYMGVPVISLAGQSLISRMGLSILVNLDAADWAVDNESAYVSGAIALARDKNAVRRFRREARQRFGQSALGNGALFAREFETACIDLLQQKKAGTLSPAKAIAPLPADELVRRAYAVMRTGHTDAAQRILNYCLGHYPGSGGAHLLMAQQISAEGRKVEAIAYLQARLAHFVPKDQVGVLISLARLHLQCGERSQFEGVVERLGQSPLREVMDVADALQVRLYQAQCAKSLDVVLPAVTAAIRPRRIAVIMPCDDIARCAQMQAQLNATCPVPPGCVVEFLRCDERSRAQAYRAALKAPDADVLVLLQKNMQIYQHTFWGDVLIALEDKDAIGFAGAMRWGRMNWRADVFAQKAAGFLLAPTEEGGDHELQWVGTRCETLVQGAAVLDGSLIVVNVAAVAKVAVDDDLADAGLLMEEVWSHALFQAGLRLGIHRNLGVLMNSQTAFYAPNPALGRLRVADQYAFDPFTEPAEDHMVLSTPVKGPDEASAVMQQFLQSTTHD
jgi:protein O-GlcNAc transferase